MKINYLFLLFIFFASNLFGQTEVNLYKTIYFRNDVSPNEYRTHRVDEFEYNNSGALIENIIKYYDESGEIKNWWGNFYEYNANGNLLKETYRRYNFEIGVWITIEWIDYVYNSFGCEIQKSKTENLGGLFSRLEYERNANCQITKESLYSKLTTSDEIRLARVKEFIYLQDGISYQEKTYDASFANGDLRLQSEIEYQFNQNGQIENIYSEVQHTFGGYWYESNREYTYNQYNNLIKEATSFKDEPNADWELNSEFIFINEYDDNDRLVKRVREKYIYPVPGGPSQLDNQYGHENRFDYLCSGLVDQEEDNYGTGTVTYRTNHFYEGEDECFEIENVMLEMSVFPNPSLGEITIESPVLESGNTQVMVFGINGNLLLEKNEFRREKSTTVDLSHLPNGIYVVQLMNQDYFTQNKVMIIN